MPFLKIVKMSEFNYPKFVLIKRTQVGLCIFNILLTTVIAIVAVNLANEDVDDIHPAPTYPSLIKVKVCCIFILMFSCL